MVVPLTVTEPTELRAPDGRPFCYLVPPAEWVRLQDELASLRERLAAAIRERDHHLAKREELLRTRFPPPPTEEEVLAAAPNSHVITQIIADLEGR